MREKQAVISQTKYFLCICGMVPGGVGIRCLMYRKREGPKAEGE